MRSGGRSTFARRETWTCQIIQYLAEQVHWRIRELPQVLNGAKRCDRERALSPRLNALVRQYQRYALLGSTCLRLCGLSPSYRGSLPYKGNRQVASPSDQYRCPSKSLRSDETPPRCPSPFPLQLIQQINRASGLNMFIRRQCLRGLCKHLHSSRHTSLFREIVTLFQPDIQAGTCL